MNSIKILALAAVFAVGTSAFGLAEEAAPDSIANHEPIAGTPPASIPATAQVPPSVVPVASYRIPASQWIADRFNPNLNRTVEESWFLRTEATQGE